MIARYLEQGKGGRRISKRFQDRPMATDIGAFFRSSLSDTKEDGTQRDAIVV